MRFQSVASSSDGCSYVLRSDVGFPPLLIEAGAPLTELQRATSWQLSKCAGCICSHKHSDHYRSAPQLSKYCEVIVPEDETLISRKGWLIQPFQLVHDEPCFGFLIGDGRQSLLYITDTGYITQQFHGVSILAIECNFSEAILEARTRNGRLDPKRFTRVYRNHLSLERLIDFLKANKWDSLREVHLLHLSDGNSDELLFKREVQSVVGVPVYVAAKKS